jgi:hypothetical protein
MRIQLSERVFLDSIGLAGGAVHDPIASIVFCHPPGVELSVVNGQVCVQEGRLLDVELPVLARAD